MKKKTSRLKSTLKKITIDDINSMSLKRLSSFIKGILSGNELVAGDYDDLPYILLIDIYRSLDPSVRQAFEDVILTFLSDLARNPRSGWRGENGDELLLLISNIFRDSPRMKDAVDSLLFIVKKGWHIKGDGVDLHWRAAQTLVGINYPAKPHFWSDVYIKGGIEYGGVVFAGLTLSSLSYAVDWLTNEISKPPILEAFFGRLPLLVEQYGIDKVAEYVLKLLPHISESRVEEFRELASNLGIRIVSGVLGKLDHHDLLTLGNELIIAVSKDTNDDNEIRLSIEQALRERASSYTLYKNKIPDVEIISCISEFIEKMPYVLSQKLRDHFLSYGKMLLATRDLGDDANRLAEEVYKIQERGINIIRQINEIMEQNNEH